MQNSRKVLISPSKKLSGIKKNRATSRIKTAFLILFLIMSWPVLAEEYNPFVAQKPIQEVSDAHMPDELMIGVTPMSRSPSNPPPGSVYVATLNKTLIFFNKTSGTYVYEPVVEQ